MCRWWVRFVCSIRQARQRPRVDRLRFQRWAGGSDNSRPVMRLYTAFKHVLCGLGPPRWLTDDRVLRIGDHCAADASGYPPCPPVGSIFSWNEFGFAVILT